MSIWLACGIEAAALVHKVWLGLRFKAECAVAHLGDIAAEAFTVTEEITYIKLYAGLVGIDRKSKAFTRNLSDKTKLLASKALIMSGCAVLYR